jgi:hypothetical protein
MNLALRLECNDNDYVVYVIFRGLRRVHRQLLSVMNELLYGILRYIPNWGVEREGVIEALSRPPSRFDAFNS